MGEAKLFFVFWVLLYFFSIKQFWVCVGVSQVVWAVIVVGLWQLEIKRISQEWGYFNHFFGMLYKIKKTISLAKFFFWILLRKGFQKRWSFFNFDGDPPPKVGKKIFIKFFRIFVSWNIQYQKFTISIKILCCVGPGTPMSLAT